MNRLSENYFATFKNVSEDRLDNVGMYVLNIGTLIYTGFMIGVPYLVIKTWGSVGWELLNPFIQSVFKIEGILLLLQLLTIIFCFKVNNFNQKILSVSSVINAYNMAIAPFITITYISMDRGNYEYTKIYLLRILILGLILHCIFLNRWIRKIRQGTYGLNIQAGLPEKKNAKNVFGIFPLIIIIVLFSIILIRKMPESSVIILILVAVVLLICITYAVCEFIIVAYCIFRFPSFAVKPPSEKKSQYVNPKNQRKKKREKNKKSNLIVKNEMVFNS